MSTQLTPKVAKEGGCGVRTETERSAAQTRADRALAQAWHASNDAGWQAVSRTAGERVKLRKLFRELLPRRRFLDDYVADFDFIGELTFTKQPL